MLIIEVEPYPLLKVEVFSSTFTSPIEDLALPPDSIALLSLEADAPVSRSEPLRTAIRDLLRHKGYKPTGRGKPASEYLIKAADSGRLSSINIAVDVCNIVSLHSGFPISVIDLDRVDAPLSIKPASSGDRYIFNASGQEIDVTGLLCVHDQDGPCANPVKDSQRTKTTPRTTRTLTVIWGLTTEEGQLQAAKDWYVALIESAGGMVERWRVK